MNKIFKLLTVISKTRKYFIRSNRHETLSVNSKKEKIFGIIIDNPLPLDIYIKEVSKKPSSRLGN